MPEYYYSTQPFLAWCLNHYFYNKNHYVWVGAPFYPYRAKNPVSSSPYKIYAQLYEPFKESDRFNKFVIQFRMDLKRGIQQQIKEDDILKNTLLDICDTEMSFFYPLVYRVDIEQIAESHRKRIANSGKEVGSNEYLIRDLQETEFDILFADFKKEDNLSEVHLQLLMNAVEDNEVLEILEARSL